MTLPHPPNAVQDIALIIYRVIYAYGIYNLLNTFSLNYDFRTHVHIGSQEVFNLVKDLVKDPS